MNTAEKRKHRLPLFCKIIYLTLGVSVLLYVLFLLSADFADFFNNTVGLAGRVLLGTLTSILPFSLAEALLLLLPVLLVTACVIGYRRYCDSWRGVFTYLGILLSFVAVILNIFVWNFAAGYYTPTLDRKLELARTPVKAEELYQTAELLANELHTLAPMLTAKEDGETVMPYSYAEMNKKLLDAYEIASEKYGAFSTFSSSVKPVMLSEPMSYTHITGVYTFFTGEANINVNFPDYTIPYTAAHELAHQRGIAREDEANFVAFLVCMEADDSYIRYSGVLNMYEYVISALRTADVELYRESYLSLPASVRAEETAYSAFFDKYRENVAATVTQTTNDTYLKTQGASAGTKSYSMVVDLAVALYRPQFD
ncbi:MAG: DUF3810 domain-containing protein [Ruminococcaceae bacterium]|nr:DUF3810 domain-containing protein [Oscillospiraceae bacterium]